MAYDPFTGQGTPPWIEETIRIGREGGNPFSATSASSPWVTPEHPFASSHRAREQSLPEEDTESFRFSDLSKAFAAGTVGGAAGIMEVIGADTARDYLKKTSLSFVDAMSDEAKEEYAKPLFSEDKDFYIDEGWTGKSVALKVSHLLGTQVDILLPGGLLGKGLRKAMKVSRRDVRALAAEKYRKKMAEGAKYTKDDALRDAANHMKGRIGIAHMAGFGIAEGAVSAGLAGMSVRDRVKTLEPEVYKTSSRYWEEYNALAETNPNATEAELESEALNRMADNAAFQAKLMVGPTTALLGAAAGYYLWGPLLAGQEIAKKFTPKIPFTDRALPGRNVMLGAAGESLQEGPQSAAEQFFSNLAVQQADMYQKTSEGVIPAALEGAVLGAGVGGAMGGLAGAAGGEIARQEKVEISRGESAKDFLTDEQKASNIHRPGGARKSIIEETPQWQLTDPTRPIPTTEAFNRPTEPIAQTGLDIIGLGENIRASGDDALVQSYDEMVNRLAGIRERREALVRNIDHQETRRSFEYVLGNIPPTGVQLGPERSPETELVTRVGPPEPEQQNAQEIREDQRQMPLPWWREQIMQATRGPNVQQAAQEGTAPSDQEDAQRALALRRAAIIDARYQVKPSDSLLAVVAKMKRPLDLDVAVSMGVDRPGDKIAQGTQGLRPFRRGGAGITDIRRTLQEAYGFDLPDDAAFVEAVHAELRGEPIYGAGGAEIAGTAQEQQREIESMEQLYTLAEEAARVEPGADAILRLKLDPTTTRQVLENIIDHGGDVRSPDYRGLLFWQNLIRESISREEPATLSRDVMSARSDFMSMPMVEFTEKWGSQRLPWKSQQADNLANALNPPEDQPGVSRETTPRTWAEAASQEQPAAAPVLSRTDIRTTKTLDRRVKDLEKRAEKIDNQKKREQVYTLRDTVSAFVESIKDGTRPESLVGVRTQRLIEVLQQRPELPVRKKDLAEARAAGITTQEQWTRAHNDMTMLGQPQQAEPETGDLFQQAEQRSPGAADELTYWYRSQQVISDLGADLVDEKPMSKADLDREVAAVESGEKTLAQVKDEYGFRFSLGDQEGGAGLTQDMTREELNQAFPKLAQRRETEGKLSIDTAADLPTDIPELAPGMVVKGYYDPETDTAHIIADNLMPGEVRPTFLHESVHQHLKPMIGDRPYNNIMNTVQRMVERGNADMVAARNQVPEDTPADHINEETLANFIQNNPDATFLQRLWGRIKLWANKHGLADLTQNDLVGIAHAAIRRRTRPQDTVEHGGRTYSIGADLRRRLPLSIRQMTGDVETVPGHPDFVRTPEQVFTEITPTEAQEQSLMLQNPARKKRTTAEFFYGKGDQDNLINRMVTQVVDSTRPIKKYSEHAWMMARMIARSWQLTEAQVIHGDIYLDRESGNTNYKDREHLHSGLMLSINKMPRQEINIFTEWMKALRANWINQRSDNAQAQVDADKAQLKALKAEAKSLQEAGAQRKMYREQLEWIKGLQANIKNNEKIAAVRERSMTQEMIDDGMRLNQGTMRDGQSRAEIFEDVRRDIERMNNAIVDFGEAAGLLDPAERRLLQSAFYLPFYRLVEEGEFKGPANITRFVNQEGYKRLQGSDKPMGDLLNNLVNSWHNIIEQSLKNQAAAKAIQAAEEVTLPSGKQAVERIEDMAQEKGDNSVFIRQEGQEVWYNINDPELYTALATFHTPAISGRVMNALRWFKQALTYTVSMMPGYRAANAFRDSIQAMATAPTPSRFNIFSNTWRGKQLTKPGSQEEAMLLVGGGEMRFGQIAGSPGEATGSDILTKRLDPENILNSPEKIKGFNNRLKALWRRWEDLGSRIENLQRAGIYEYVLKQTRDKVESGEMSQEYAEFLASFKARDYMDFSQYGASPTVQRAIGVISFLNARIQGLDKLVRSLKEEDMATGKRQWISRMAPVLGTYILVETALYLMQKDDEEFRKRPQWDRDSNLWVRITDDWAVALPKPFELGAIGSIVNRAIEQAVDSDNVHAELFWERAQHIVLEQLSMNPIPTGLLPLAEVWANHDYFRDAPIHGPGMEGLSPEQKRHVWTSETAVALSKAYNTIAWERVELSPLQVENILSGWFGQSAALALGALDVMWESAAGKQEPARNFQSSVVGRLGGGRFLRELPESRAFHVDKFYEHLEEFTRLHNDWKRHRKFGEMAQAQALAEKEGRKIDAKRGAARIAREMTAINEEIQQIHVDKEKYTPYHKKVLIDRLNQTKLLLAKDYIDDLKAAGIIK